MSNFVFRSLEAGDLPALREFTDREIGAGYYSAADLADIYQRSRHGQTMLSLILLNPSGGIEGVRITFPPGQWSKGKGLGLCVDRWPHPLQDTAYFQSIFLSPAAQGAGWGGRLSQEALRRLKQIGAHGVVCHSWKQSPHGSSTRYLIKLGFQRIAEHPEYWRDVQYNCPICIRPPCLCTAEEMYLDLEITT